MPVKVMVGARSDAAVLWIGGGPEREVFLVSGALVYGQL